MIATHVCLLKSVALAYMRTQLHLVRIETHGQFRPCPAFNFLACTFHTRSQSQICTQLHYFETPLHRFLNVLPWKQVIFFRHDDIWKLVTLTKMWNRVVVVVGGCSNPKLGRWITKLCRLLFGPPITSSSFVISLLSNLSTGLSILCRLSLCLP
jgi:hypothetical protein